MLRIGLVGVKRGRIIRNLKLRGDIEFSAVCDIRFQDEFERKSFADDWSKAGIKFEKIYGSFDEFLNHNLDLVIIATPPHLHTPQSIQAIERGFNVISEVPSAVDIEQAKNLVQAVRNSDKKYILAENCCYWPFVLAWKKMIKEGKLGTIFYMEGEYIHNIRNLMTDEYGHSTWRAEFEPIQYCTHETGPLLDMIEDRGVNVSAFGSLPASSPEYNLPNAELAAMKTEKGVLIKLLVSFDNPCNDYHRYLVLGTKGMLRTRTDWNTTYAIFRDIPHLLGEIKLPLGTSEPNFENKELMGHGSADWKMLNSCIDAIKNNAPPPIDVYRGLDYTLPGICAVESLRRGGLPIDIPDPRKFS